MCIRDSPMTLCTEVIKFVKLDLYLNRLNISRNTLNTRLEDILKFLKRYALTFEIKIKYTCAFSSRAASVLY